MQREVTAIVLCILAQGAAAQCVATPAAPVAPAPAVVNETARPAGAAPAAPNAVRPGGELIKTAAAGTRDDAPPAGRGAMAARPAEQEHPHRSGTAMLLAALALMSGIALRRYGARDS